MPRSLIVLPEDSAKPILNAIDRASRTLRLKMFLLSDPILLKSRLHNLVHDDWTNSHRLDLTDDGLQADLEAQSL